tara:strand:- start:41 stop:895 length:855 start_codon:yes stop_codon:yes gene_type:complete
MFKQSSQQISVIRPDSRVNDGMIVALHHILGEVWNFRSHIRVVFKEQFRAAYTGTGLGLFWNYLLPLVPLSVYWFLSKLRVFPNFDGVDGATFITFGVTLWFLFVGCVQTPIQVVQLRNKESMKTTFPLSASIVSGFAQLLFETAVRLVLVILIIVVGQSWPAWSALLLPLLLLPALMLFIGVGLLLGILNVIYKDISRVVTISLQYGIFISGVIFPFHHIEVLLKLNMFNPFAIYIDLSRSIVFQGEVINMAAYLTMSCVALALFLVAARLFYIMEYRVRGIG